MRRNAVAPLDVPIIAATLALAAIGVLFVYSSGIGPSGAVRSQEWIKQIVWVATGLVLMVWLAVSDLNRIKSLTLLLYVGALILLAVTAVVGRDVNGARSWLGIGALGGQPSEFAKITTILFLATYLTGIGNGVQELPRFLLGLGIALGPVVLILLQPDLGTALVYGPVFLVMAFIAGAQVRHLLFIALSVILATALAALPTLGTQPWTYIAQVINFTTPGLITLGGMVAVILLALWGFVAFGQRYFYWLMYGSSFSLVIFLGSALVRSVLQDYQMMRLVIFLNPGLDPRGAGWTIIQSMTAVGSGGLSGKGFLQGTQSHYRYLPQQSTDFIFSILAEEWGFLGGLLVLSLFAAILGRGLYLVFTVRDEYARLVAAGIVGMIFFHALVNTGMATGVMPITGIPLMFLSYGGSSAWTGMLAVGLLLAIGRQRRRPS